MGVVMNENNNNVENEKSKKTKWMNIGIIILSLLIALLLEVPIFKGLYISYREHKTLFSGLIDFIKWANEETDNIFYKIFLGTYPFFLIMTYIAIYLIVYVIILTIWEFIKTRMKPENRLYKDLKECIPNYKQNLKIHRMYYFIEIIVAALAIMLIVDDEIIGILSGLFKSFNSIVVEAERLWGENYIEILYAIIQVALVLIGVGGLYYVYRIDKKVKSLSGNPSDYVVNMKAKIDKYFLDENYKLIEDKIRAINNLKLKYMVKTDWESVVIDIIGFSLTAIGFVYTVGFSAGKKLPISFYDMILSVIVIAFFVILTKHNHISFIKSRELIDYVLEEYKSELLEEEKTQNKKEHKIRIERKIMIDNKSKENTKIIINHIDAKDKEDIKS